MQPSLHVILQPVQLSEQVEPQTLLQLDPQPHSVLVFATPESPRHPSLHVLVHPFLQEPSHPLWHVCLQSPAHVNLQPAHI